MKKVTNHKGWLTAILSIIPFFIFSAIFQGLGFVFTSLLGSRGVIDFDFEGSYLSILFSLIMIFFLWKYYKKFAK